MISKTVEPSRDKKTVERSGLNSNVLRRVIFDTKNDYYFFTELSKEQYAK